MQDGSYFKVCNSRIAESGVRISSDLFVIKIAQIHTKSKANKLWRHTESQLRSQHTRLNYDTHI